MTSEWVPQNGFDIIGAAKTYDLQIYGANPNLMASQGIPEGVNEYGKYICFGGTYPVLIYVSGFGEVGIYGSFDNVWRLYSGTKQES